MVYSCLDLRPKILTDSYQEKNRLFLGSQVRPVLVELTASKRSGYIVKKTVDDLRLYVLQMLVRPRRFPYVTISVSGNVPVQDTVKNNRLLER